MSLRLASELINATLPTDRVIQDHDGKKPFETDGLTAYREVPGLVVLPQNTLEIQTVLRICKECLVPVITRGAGTGLSGGARPHAEGVLLVLSRMNRILQLDFDACTATLEPGVTNLSISEAVADEGLFYAPDPSSQIACSIGGNVAENAGGVHCLKYGLTLHNVLGLKVQMLEGFELVLGGKSYEGQGAELIPLIVGSEGLLGVVSEITVKLLPKPTAKQVIMASFDGFEAAGDCVSSIIASGIMPAGLELMDELAIRAAEEFAHCGYPVGAGAILLCEIDGFEEVVLSESERVRQIMQQHRALDIVEATTDEAQERLWRGRKSAFPAAGRLAPDYYCMDGTIPRHMIGRVLVQIARLGDKFDLGIANVFHAGDGNLHPLILYDASKEGELMKAELLGREILELCVAVGGTVTGEHGVGIEKLDPMCSQFNPDELEQFFRVKRCFDVNGLLNPGKAIPTLARCGELKGKPVNTLDGKFRDLPRF